MIEKKTCKKCGKILPIDYKYNKCESCRNKTLGEIREAGKVVGGIALTVVPFILKNVLGRSRR